MIHQIRIILPFIVGLTFLFSCSGTEKKSPKPDSTNFNPNQAVEQVLLMDKYVMLFEDTEGQFKRYGYFNNQLSQEMQKEIKDTALVRKMKDLRNWVNFVNKYLGFAKYYLYANIGGEYDETRYTVKKPFEIAKVEKYMLGITKNGQAYILEAKLNDFVDFVNKEFKDLNEKGFARMTLTFSENPLFKDFPQLKKMDFAESRFKGVPVVLAMAIISQLQVAVLVYEANILELIKKGEARN